MANKQALQNYLILIGQLKKIHLLFVATMKAELCTSKVTQLVDEQVFKGNFNHIENARKIAAASEKTSLAKGHLQKGLIDVLEAMLVMAKEGKIFD